MINPPMAINTGILSVTVATRPVKPLDPFAVARVVATMSMPTTSITTEIVAEMAARPAPDIDSKMYSVFKCVKESLEKKFPFLRVCRGVTANRE